VALPKLAGSPNRVSFYDTTEVIKKSGNTPSITYNRCGVGVDQDNFPKLFRVGSEETKKWYANWAKGDKSAVLPPESAPGLEERRSKESNRRLSFPLQSDEEKDGDTLDVEDQE